MKKCIKLVVFFVLSVMFCVFFAILASAETFSVQYKSMVNWDGNRDYKKTDANGQITLLSTGYTTDAGNYEITGPDGNKITVQRQFYGWYDEKGNFYEKGATVTFTENVTLREALGFEVYTYEDLTKYLGKFFWYIRLGADITATETIKTQNTSDQNLATLDLNGHNITSTAEYAFAGQRCGFIIMGNGTINHSYNGTSGGLWNSTVNGYAEGRQRLWIGKGVTVNTTGALLHSTNDWIKTQDKLLVICGKTNSAYLANTLSIPEGKVFEIHKSADVTVTQPEIIINRSSATTKQITVKIYGGRINFPDDADYFTEFLRNRYEIIGGSFVNELPSGVLKYGYGCVYNGTTRLYDVVLVECTAEGTNGVHDFKLQEAYNNMAVTCLDAGLHTYRCACGISYIDDVAPLGHDYSIISIQKEATATENGIKKASCSRCDDSYTYEYCFDPREQVVTIVVKTQNGTKEITGAAKDFYISTVEETMDVFAATIDGVMTIVDPDDSQLTYTVAHIVRLVIPSGFTGLSANAILNATSLEEIMLLDGANVVFATDSIKNCTSLKNITVGNATITFRERALNGCTSFETLDVENANVAFDKNSFRESSIKNLKLGKDKKYSFGENSFYKAKLESLVFPDGTNPIASGGQSLVSFTGAAVFYATNLKYVYFGANVIAPNSSGQIWISNKPFDCANRLEVVVLMDITHINEYVFCCNGNANSTAEYREGKYGQTTPLRVYHHGNTLTVNDKAFANRTVLGVELYTFSKVSALPNCAYTVYQGIAHAYYASTITESTCVTKGTSGYVTDCLCGEDYRANAYKTFSTLNAGINDVENVAYGTDIILLPLLDYHTESDIFKDVVFENGHENLGFKAYKCLYCDEISKIEDEATYPALFTCLGYSATENGVGGITVGYIVNTEAIEGYTRLTGKTVKYGVFAVSKEKLGENDIFDSEGAVASNVISAEVSKHGHAAFELKIVGFTNENKGLKFAMGAYVAVSNDGATEYSYMQADVPNEGEKYCFISYNDIVGSITRY